MTWIVLPSAPDLALPDGQAGLGGSPRDQSCGEWGAYGARTRNLLEPQSDALRPDTPLTPKAGWPPSGP